MTVPGPSGGMEGPGEGGDAGGPTVGGPQGVQGVHSWRERCLLLEDSMNRFRQQASKIRNALGHKVGAGLRLLAVCHAPLALTALP